VIGVDDFALRRGQRYGTVIVDQERHRPIDLLPDRTAETLAAWLRGQDTLTTITRDRSTEYARGIAASAPHVVEVLDRWHLHKNLREAVERVLSGQQQAVQGLTLPARDGAGTATLRERVLAPPPRSRPEQAKRQAKWEQRRRRYEAIRALHSEGVSLRVIGRRLGCSRWLVRRAITADAAPERHPNRRVPSMLDPFEPYLQQRWAQGCHTALQLWRELRERGYPGSRKRVTQWVQQRREAPAPTTPRRYRQTVATRIAAGPRWRTASVGQLTWLLLREPDDLAAAEGTVLAQMRQASPLIERAYPLIREFLRILRQRTPEALDAWFARVAASDVVDLQTFADGLQGDREALRQALVQPYSNGISEGFVNKIKLLKRQMFGRANFDLLRLRVLLA
jgi:transposase